jgi:hypothetical protein
MFQDQDVRKSQNPIRQSDILRQSDLGFKPEFRLALDMLDVHVRAKLLAREEVEAKPRFAMHCRTQSGSSV